MQDTMIILPCFLRPSFLIAENEDEKEDEDEEKDIDEDDEDNDDDEDFEENFFGKHHYMVKN